MMTMSKHLRFNDPDYVPCRTCRDRKDLQKQLRKTQRKLDRLEKRHTDKVEDFEDTIRCLRRNAKARRLEMDGQHQELVLLRKQLRSVLHQLHAARNGHDA